MKTLKTTKVEGTDKANVLVFALSTCIWCKRVKELLNTLGVAYEYVYVDETMGKEREEIIQTLKQWNPQLSYPTTVINNKTCIIGFKEQDLREAIAA